MGPRNPFALHNPDSEEYRLLSEQIGDRYPARPYLSYLTAERAPDRLAAMQELAARYAGDPFRFLPEKRVLDEKLFRLQNDKDATEDDFKALYDEALAFEKAAKAEKGIHERGDVSIYNIKNTLTQSHLWIRFRNDSIVLIGRNFGRGKLRFSSDEHNETVTLRNRDGRFYVLDTVMAPVPELPDGSYNVYSDSPYARATYNKHSLSISVRRQGDDFYVYVADYQTGEPLPSATIRLKSRMKTLERTVPLDGLTPLPAEFQKMIGKRKVYTLEARVGDRRSPTVNVYRTEDVVERDWSKSTTLYGRIYKDRGAYRPGDTLKAKAVLFEGYLRTQVATAKEGEDIRVHIFNAEGKTLTDINLKTNSFGSVAWEFPIPVGERNGLFGIYVYYKNSNVAHTQFRVDDFVLPTYEVDFDPQDGPFLPDTDIEISGKLYSYSGHPVDGISLEGRVTRYGTEEWKGPVSTDIDGSFRIPFHPSKSGPYILNIKALDATGETREFEHSFQVTTSLSLDVELENPGEGEFFFRHARYEDETLTEPVGIFSWTVKNGSESISMPVAYQLTDVNGKKLLEGTSEDTLELDLSPLPDGLYFLRGIVAEPYREGNPGPEPGIFGKQFFHPVRISCEDNHRAVLRRGYLDRHRKDGFSPHLGVVHIRVGDNRALRGGFLHEGGQYLHRVQTAVGVRQDTAHLHTHGTDEDAAPLRPARVFVEHMGGEVALPLVLASGEGAEVTAGNTHTLRQLTDGVVVHREATFRHKHLHPSLVGEGDNGLVVVLLQLDPDGGDVVLLHLALLDEAAHSVLHPLGVAGEHTLNLVNDYLIETLLLGHFAVGDAVEKIDVFHCVEILIVKRLALPQGVAP